MPILKHLNLPRRQRNALILVFAIGFLTCITSIMRFNSLVIIASSADLTYLNADTATWSSGELNIGVICACLPALRPVLTRLVPKLMLSSANGSSINPSNRYGTGTNGGGGHGSGMWSKRFSSTAGSKQQQSGNNFTFKSVLSKHESDGRSDSDHNSLITRPMKAACWADNNGSNTNGISISASQGSDNSGSHSPPRSHGLDDDIELGKIMVVTDMHQEVDPLPLQSPEGWDMRRGKK
jgi:hypothetical protein